MYTLQQLLDDIEASPEGPNVAAIFDFDGTIISGYSANALMREQLKRGDITARDLVEIMSAMTNLGLGNLSFSGFMLASAQLMRGKSESSFKELGEKIFIDQIARSIYPETRELIKAHQAKGHTVAIISSATPYQLKSAADDLGITHVLCNHLEIDNGLFTGEIVRPVCFGEGKVTAAERLSSLTGADLGISYFYSDSKDDLELLEKVGNPRVLNADSELQDFAQKNKWISAKWNSRGVPTVAEFVRSVAATGSFVTSFVAGLPIWALTGSKKDAQNFSYSLFADVASALVGMKLNAIGEKHLWTHRPCVFVFNHQSKADQMIIAKLVRRDTFGIGKQEIKKMPLLGRTLEYAGTIFIDRANAASAIEAMQPVVQAIKEEGRSVAIAPEGTRTVSPKLAPFKKGPFHIAIQAGVPIVPIVIGNALDVAPKGDFVFRSATVNVEVLPPVDTSDWSAATIDAHVAEVRDMFLKTLGQEDSVPSVKDTRRPKARRRVKDKSKKVSNSIKKGSGPTA